MTNQYIASVDVGTTSIRCQITNSQGQILSSACIKVNLLYPQPGYVEINPDELWSDVCSVIKSSVADANISIKEILLGISTQRGTFTTWRKDNSQPFHNFITWKDLRSDTLVKQWNQSFLMKTFRIGCYALYLVTRNKRFLAGSSLKIANTQSTMRLVWVLKNIPQLKQAIENKNVMFGTVDTWLLYKFSGGRKHITDITNASATGFYDPFVLSWAIWAKRVLNIPISILPEVVDNDYSFGYTDKSVFGYPVPIKCVISDQSASMFGSCCFNYGDIKVTLGTGTFLDVNTKQMVHGSASGLYPLVGWKLNNELTYFIEGACNDTGSIIQWALSAGIIENPYESSDLANSVENTDGVYFVPAFSGLGPPIMDDNAASGFIGLKATSRKQHMIRAILESIVFRFTLLYNLLQKETNLKIKGICIDGGVANNDFVCQLLANILGIEVYRPSTTEVTILGVTFITGLKAGIWKTRNELKKMRALNSIFKPSSDMSVYENCMNEFSMWLKAVDRFKLWYNLK
ncbi:hypothetical protein RN001_000985 [Aquatica leii]|uniref:Glycerol kinase 5 n=1 Tax=Aquatica leii TaxID=1421715 RepID=A0AAN7SKX7_9COLE|nr:hypothetical protein RN001_000985 [Aquatica leii]